jgi:hypothetical protein
MKGHTVFKNTKKIKKTYRIHETRISQILFLLIILTSLVGLNPTNVIDAPDGIPVQFDGSNDYVTFGQTPNTLGLSSFTLESWINWTGSGVTTSSGLGGLTSIIPIISKGRG